MSDTHYATFTSNTDAARYACAEQLDAALRAWRDTDHASIIERCAQVADAMSLNPWGAVHDAISPGSLAKQIARAIRDLVKP
jgi:phage head maturation protease